MYQQAKQQAEKVEDWLLDRMQDTRLGRIYTTLDDSLLFEVPRTCASFALKCVYNSAVALTTRRPATPEDRQAQRDVVAAHADRQASIAVNPLTPLGLYITDHNLALMAMGSYIVAEGSRTYTEARAARRGEEALTDQAHTATKAAYIGALLFVAGTQGQETWTSIERIAHDWTDLDKLFGFDLNLRVDVVDNVLALTGHLSAAAGALWIAAFDTPKDSSFLKSQETPAPDGSN